MHHHNLKTRAAYTVKVKCNISKKQDLLIIYISYISPYSPSGSRFNKMIIMLVMLHLEYDFIIPRHNYQSETCQQF